MFVPEGYTEEEVINIINSVLSKIAPAFCFGYYEKEDMMQEGFIIAMSILPGYDKKYASLETFLTNSIKRRFLNMIRDKFYRYTPPCDSCKDSGTCDECSCEKFIAWNKKNKIKKNLMDFPDYDGCVVYEDTDQDEEIYGKELLSYVSERVPLAIRADFCRLIDGAKLSKLRKEELVATIKEILEDFK